MKKLLQKTALLSTVLMTACVNAGNWDNYSVKLSHCAIQETIPGAKATGAFLTMTKEDDAPLSVVAAKIPAITKRVELHEMLMKDNKMMMSQIKEFPLKKGENVFKKGGYHIMLLDIEKPVKAGEKYDITLKFSDGTYGVCNAEVKTVKELTPKHMKGMMKHGDMEMDHSKMKMEGEMKMDHSKMKMPAQ